MKKNLLLITVLLIGIAIGALVTKGVLTKVYQKHIALGTAGITGVTYPTGGVLCRLVNATFKEYGTRCVVEVTGGSVTNLSMLRSGDLDVGIVQSDQQISALQGSGVFGPMGPDNHLRSLFSLYPEAFTVVARPDSGIYNFGDLKGKRVNIGNPGSGQRATIESIMREKGWTLKDFKSVSELTASEQAQALCDNKVDAIVFFAGHPNSSIQEVTGLCGGILIDLDDLDIKKLIATRPDYEEYIISGDMYLNNPKETTVLGGRNTVVTTARLGDEMAYQITRALFENLNAFKELHPSFRDLTIEDMVYTGNTAPLHPGAEIYYREKNWCAPSVTLTGTCLPPPSDDDKRGQ